MDPKLFDEYVNELLAPALKSQVAKNARYRSQDAIRQEVSIRLAPKKELTPCSDCDKLVANRVVHYLAKNRTSDYPNWEKKCVECGEKTKINLVDLRKKR